MAQCLDESDEFDCPMTTTTKAVAEEEEEEEGEAEMFWFGSAYDEDAFEEGGEGAEEDQVSLIFMPFFSPFFHAAFSQASRAQIPLWLPSSSCFQ